MEKKSPRFSVVMPVWNRQDCVQNAVASIFNQTEKDWEMIVVDDGSTDATERIVKSFEHPRLHYYKIPHSGCIGKVRNYGIQKATGEWIVVQDSDDRSMPERLEWIGNKIDSQPVPELDIVYHDMYVNSFDAQHNAAVRELRHVGPYSKAKIMNVQYIPGQIAYRREVALRTPYDERIEVSDDFQILVEFAMNNYNFGYIDRPIYDYFMRSDSVNILGELDGRRFSDAKIIISILKEKYDLEVKGELKKWNMMTGRTIKHEYVE